MTKELFDKIFDYGIQNFITEVQENNPRIKTHNLQERKQKAYRAYEDLMSHYRSAIFSKDDNCLLDRHRIASCICGAFLKTDIFNKSDLVEQIKQTKTGVEAAFYYVNELVALHAGCKYLSYFMGCDKKDDPDLFLNIMRKFPNIPQTTLVKRGFLSCVLFNLSQIKDEGQIGIAHYDMYSYAMLFFHLEQGFYRELKSDCN